MDSTTKDNIIILSVMALIVVAVTWLGVREQEEYQKTTPIAEQERHSRCLSKADRSRPSCWTKVDWAIYCSRVQCKH